MIRDIIGGVFMFACFLVIVVCFFCGCTPAKEPTTGRVCVDTHARGGALVLRRWIPGSAAAGYPLQCATYAHKCRSTGCEALAP